MKKEQVDKGGRPKKAAVEGSLVQLGLRIPAELKNKLDHAADQAGRAQSHEAARRLQASFEWQPIIDLIAAIEAGTGASWKDDGQTRDLVICVVNSYFRSFADDIGPNRSISNTFDRHWLKSWYERMCAEIDEFEARAG